MATPNEIQQKIALKRQQMAIEKSSDKRWQLQKDISKLELEKKLSAMKKG
jgi:hypothetical protein